MRKSYTVEATHSGHWWVLEEPSVGCVSQVRRLSEAADEMREAIAYQTGLDEADIRVVLRQRTM